MQEEGIRVLDRVELGRKLREAEIAWNVKIHGPIMSKVVPFDNMTKLEQDKYQDMAVAIYLIALGDQHG